MIKGPTFNIRLQIVCGGFGRGNVDLNIESDGDISGKGLLQEFLETRNSNSTEIESVDVFIRLGLFALASPASCNSMFVCCFDLRILCIYVCVCISICTNICVCVYICIYMYMY